MRRLRSRRSVSVHGRLPRLTLRVILLAAVLTGVPVAQAASVTISADDIEGPGFTARAARASLDPRGAGRLQVHTQLLTTRGREWRNAALVCEPIVRHGTEVGCGGGALELGQRIPVRGVYDSASGAIDLELTPAAGGRWLLAGRPDDAGWRGRVTLEQAGLAALAAYLPPGAPAPSTGQVSGGVTIAFPSAGGVEVDGELVFSGVDLSNASGLIAGEKVGASWRFAAEAGDAVLRFRSDTDWKDGALYWQPLYLKSGHAVSLEGTLDARRVTIDAGRARAAGVGEVAFSATWDRERGVLVDAAGGGAALDIRGAYEALARPALATTVAGDLETAGTADFGWRFADGGMQAFYVNLHGAKFADRQGRFGLSGLDAALPWDRNAPSQARVTLARGELLRLPIGRVEIPIELAGFVARVANAEVPVLDGKLHMNDFVARRDGEGWEWSFAGGLTPVSLEVLTRTLGTHVMLGQLSAVVPKVRYRSSTVAVEGALLFQVFDGTAVVDRLSLVDPFGRIPRLFADVDMRNLDLDLVTRTFAFGSMTGRIDATVTGLELAAWQPVKFDAWVGSSPGSYPKRISQRAVENITALGGSGATAAVQRTALRLFEQFGYSRIGWRCKLENGVCEMSGITAKDGGYVIVEGGGIPAISVMGYNQTVDWQELITRLARVTREDSAPNTQ